jgi:pimeloyl-ACP methyl ester carboxylesterase
MAHRVNREIYGVAYVEKTAFKDTYGGEVGHVFIECVRLVPEHIESETVLVFSHPIGGGAFLPMVSELARAGHHVLFVNTRYRGNDTALIMEKCLLDLHAGIADARRRFGYKRVLLCGWSGGGSLSLFYQDQAERPTITHTPAGDSVDVAGAGLVPADGIMLLAAHVSRAVIMTEWLDPSIVDEHDLSHREVSLDLYAANGGPKPPFSADFVTGFRAAQLERNRRITSWVKTMLEKRIAEDGPGAELAFVVHGTMADPRWLDASLEPNDREPGTCYLGDPRIVNMGPVGLARFSTLRSWLSQWSIDDSRANGSVNGPSVSCPVLVIGNGADNACPPSHTQRLFDAIPHADKELHVIRGAGHYYAGQPEKAREAVALCTRWMVAHGFAHDNLPKR